MPTKKITDAFVRNVKPPKPKLVVDAQTGKEKETNLQVTYIDTLERGLALTLTVSYGGTKAFGVLTYRDGKPIGRKLGSYPQLSVKQAREKAQEYFKDPEKFAAQAQRDTFKEVGEEWFKRHVEGRLISAREIRRHLETYVYPKWKDRRFLEIRRPQVSDLLDHIADNNGAPQADAVLATIGSIMTWYQSRNEHYVSPIVKGMKRDKRKAEDRRRKRKLSAEEIAAVWTTAPQVHATFAAICKLLLLTAQRREKVATMQWSDVSEDDIWTIRKAEREKGTADSLKLPKLALDIIAAQARIADNPFVFAGRAGKAFNAFSERKADLDKALPGVPHWTIHDLRRTAKSLMAKAGVLPHISERVLGHVIAGVEGVYDQHTYDDEKTTALLKLEGEIKRIVDPSPQASNVVPLDLGRKLEAS